MPAAVLLPIPLAAQGGEPFGLLTVLCLVLGAGLFVLVRAHVGLRSRVEELERRLASTPANEPLAVPAATPVAAAAPAPVAAAPAAPAPIPVRASDIAPPREAAAPGIPVAHLACIAAAVHHAFKNRARLVSVQAAPGAERHAHTAVDWAREGRRDIFSSHRVR